jgi:hypothetical protein
MPQAATGSSQPSGGTSPVTTSAASGLPSQPTTSAPTSQEVITAIKPDTKTAVPINPVSTKEVGGRSRVPAKTLQELNRPVNVSFNMIGKWVGAWGDPGHLDFFYSFMLKEDGSMVLYDANGQETGSGTYEYKASNFTARYRSKSNGTIYALNGTFDPNDYSLSGSWQKELIKIDTGRWSVKKQ